MPAIIPLPAPDPDPEDVARGLADLERHLAAQTPTAPPPATTHNTAPAGLPVRAESKRVRRLRAEVAEAHEVADLQEDETPLLVDSPKVRKRRKAAHQAARLHELAKNPQMRAWQAARMRRTLLTALMVALTLALAWSTAGVQHFAAENAPAWSPSWVFAWLVEPFMSIALLGIVGARAYLGTRGQPLNDPKLVKIEWLFLGLTLGMNAWPYLPWVAESFSLSRLVLHILGPVVAVAIVTALPIILAAFARLDHDRVGDRAGEGLTGLTYSGNGHDRVRRTAADVAPLIERTQKLIAAGTLPAAPSAYRIQRALRCAMDDARVVRDALKEVA
ncbi:conjugal transfer protein TraI [Spongiactinospora rosea]|uniref:Conjugal transfer protein TraI n=1 Tax=Spongiactinospora rosea TaxID=2248750 RepID=A0A366LW64_9ACTN|nr:conjugal transfer protein TraI [Spongiactinospora rosea]RBQ17793.1 conjugal transfer protein TraI [Spongiactinospora rosea]